MSRRIDPRRFNTLLDANVLDRASGPEDAIVHGILELHEQDRVTLLLPHSVQAEIEHPKTPPAVKERARALVYTLHVTLTPSEEKRHEEVRDLVRGNAQPGKHDRDAYHMVESAKYGGYFITRDERLLKKRMEICRVLGRAFAIVTPSEFLEIYHSFEGQG